jgi:exodeoxyribonuclease VII large subunit
MTVVVSRSELTVSELSNLVACALGGIPRKVTVRGQLGDLGRGYKGHLFASLRGDGVGIRCFVHARILARMRGPLAEGDTVVVHGRVNWYRARGDIQLVADSVSLVDETTRARDIIARLQAALELEGTLRANRGLRMPELPCRVAVVGGYSSAAVLDIVTAIHRRAPWIEVTVHPTRLQGDGAHLEIASAVAAAAATAADVIAVVRGGGASNDFAPFDTKEVCRAIARASVPVVTALGHEQDRRLADLAAHTAASTPSDAARHIVPDASQLRVAVASARHRMVRALSQSLVGAEAVRTAAAMRLCTSAQRLTTGTRGRAARLTLDQRLARVAAAVRGRHLGMRTEVQRCVETIVRRISAMRDTVLRTRAQNSMTLRTRAETMRATLDVLRHRMHVAHPHNVVARGFVIARDRDGNVITQAEAAVTAGVLQLEFGDRTIFVHVSTTPSL